jgi:hypothetical protein
MVSNDPTDTGGGWANDRRDGHGETTTDLVEQTAQRHSAERRSIVPGEESVVVSSTVVTTLDELGADQCRKVSVEYPPLAAA